MNNKIKLEAKRLVSGTEVLGRTQRGKLSVRWPDGAQGVITYGGFPATFPRWATNSPSPETRHARCEAVRAASVERFGPLLDVTYVASEIKRLEADFDKHEGEQDRLEAAFAADRAENPPPSFEAWVTEAYPTRGERWGQGMTGRSCLDVYKSRWPATYRRQSWPKANSNALERLRQAL